MTKTRRFCIEKYTCMICGQAMTVPRRKKRPRGHIKHMYCIKCRKVQPFMKRGG